MDLIHVILIEHGDVVDVVIRPSHSDIENLLGTSFWVVRRLGKGNVLFHGEAHYPGREDFTFMGVPYNGNAVIARWGEYGDIESSGISLEEVRQTVEWP
jgi:hypothetical protein